MSPSSSRAQQRQRRNLLISVLAVVAISLGSFAAVFSAKWTPRLGLDLAGGLAVVYQTSKTVSQTELQETVNILNNRVNGLGVSGAEVSTAGNNEISVSIPGVKDAATVLKDIGNTAQLYFRPVLCTTYPLSLSPATKATKTAKAKPAEKAISGNGTLPACSASYATTAANLAVTPNSSVQGYSSNNPSPDPTFINYTSTSTNVKNYEHRDVLLPSLPTAGQSVNSTLRYVLGPEQMTGTSIGSAVAQQNQVGQWEVNYSLKGNAGSQLWDKVAQENFHLLLGVELDGVVQSAPIIQPSQTGFTSFDGQGTISGGGANGMTEAQAKSLAQAMEFGSLPVRLKQLTTQTVSPTLGKSALKAGLGAGIAGLVLVLLYTLVYYRALGAVVISGLGLTALALWAIISALGHTSFSPSFDLAGITGLIVSIGITVDSYIVYFERLKDETRSGRSIRTSVDRGFKSVWRTVWAADFVSLLAAVVLYVVAVGDVKGFAFFLGLSTIMDMAVTWFYTRPLVVLLGRSDRLQGGGRFGMARGLAVTGGGPGAAEARAGGAHAARRTRRWWHRSTRRAHQARAGTGIVSDDTVTLTKFGEFDDDAYDEDVDGVDGVDGADGADGDAEGQGDDDRLSMDDAARSLLGRPKASRSGTADPNRPHGALRRLYRGETRFDFVGRRRAWFTLSSVIIVAGIISIILRGGLNLGIEFKGGTEWTVKAPNVTQTQAVNAMQSAGLVDPIVQLLGQGSNQHLNVQADLNKLSAADQRAETTKVEHALATLTHTTLDNVENGVQTVGPTWGSSITNKAIEALIIFFVVVGIYISIRFEPKMALSAFIAMLHDVVVAVGIYTLFNFQVTPDTVVAILTILGYSLYDTVVVFDRVRDNTKNIGSHGTITYGQLINLSMNQTLARSINTSAVAIIPVLAVLLIGAELLGASTLQEYGLALFVGLLSGAYSSIFIASPILYLLKRNEPRWLAIERRLISRGDRGGAAVLSPAAAAALATQMSIADGGQPRTSGPAKRTGPIRPGSGAGRAGATGTGTALLDAPAQNGGRTPQAPRPRKGKKKRKR